MRIASYSCKLRLENDQQLLITIHFFLKYMINNVFFFSKKINFWHVNSDSNIVLLITWRKKWVINFLQVFVAFH